VQPVRTTPPSPTKIGSIGREEAAVNGAGRYTGVFSVQQGQGHRPYDPEPAARFVNEESKIIVIKGFKA
jgi:hypothetical protein